MHIVRKYIQNNMWLLLIMGTKSYNFHKSAASSLVVCFLEMNDYFEETSWIASRR